MHGKFCVGTACAGVSRIGIGCSRAAATLRSCNTRLPCGCNIEKLQHKTALRLERTIAINLVIAWRIMLLTLLGRECPQLPAEVLFCDLEIQVLKAHAKKKD